MMGKKRGNGEGSIHKWKDMWRGYITLGRDPKTGKRKRQYFTGPTRKIVAEKVAQALHQQQTGLLTEPTSLTVEEYMNHWLESVAKPKVRYSTYSRYSGLIKNHPYPGWHPPTRLATFSSAESLCSEVE